MHRYRLAAIKLYPIKIHQRKRRSDPTFLLNL